MWKSCGRQWQVLGDSSRLQRVRKALREQRLERERTRLLPMPKPNQLQIRIKGRRIVDVSLNGKEGRSCTLPLAVSEEAG